MEALKNLLGKLPKNTLILLVILFAGLWSKKMIKENEDRQTLILTNQQTLGTNQSTIQRGMEKGFKDNGLQHDQIILNVNEIGQKQRVVVKTLPVVDQNTIKQIEMIYEQMRKDQSTKDRRAMDESLLTPITPELNSNTAMNIQLADTLKKTLNHLENNSLVK